MTGVGLSYQEKRRRHTFHTATTVTKITTVTIMTIITITTITPASSALPPPPTRQGVPTNMRDRCAH